MMPILEQLYDLMIEESVNSAQTPSRSYRECVLTSQCWALLDPSRIGKRSHGKHL